MIQTVSGMFGGRTCESLYKKYRDAKQRGSGPNAELSSVDTMVNETVSYLKEILTGGPKSTEEQKADALQDLLFLHYQGVNVDWAEFPITEIMASSNYSVKLMAYLAASELWQPDSDAVIAIVQTIYKDLAELDPVRKSLALSLIPHIATKTLAENIVKSVTSCFNSPRDDIRQKAYTCFYSLCLKFPECLPAGIQAMRIKEILQDKSNPTGIIQSILSLINELAIHNPNNYQKLLPVLVSYFQDPAGSPWVLIRAMSIVSLIAPTLPPGSLTKFNEKITPNISEVLSLASSSSVVFEVIKLICSLHINNRLLIRNAADRAQSFIDNSDPNLRFLGLTAITKLMKFNPSIIQLHSDTITNCLESDDQTCVFIAVDLLESIINTQNLGNIVASLVAQIETRPPGVVRDTLVQRVISIFKTGTHREYDRCTDYVYYVNILMTIHSYGVECKEIADELLTMALRSPSTRPDLVDEMLDFMEEPNTSDRFYIEAAAFILGEYATGEAAEAAFECLLGKEVLQAPPSAQAMCIQNAFKLYAKSGDDDTLSARGDLLVERLRPFTSSRHTEVQERATMLSALVGVFGRSPNATAVGSLYARPLKAIDPSAQSKVQIPASLDITTPIVELNPQDNEFALDDLEDAPQPAEGVPSRDIFVLRPKSPTTKQEKKDVVVVKAGALGVQLEPRKKRRMMPIISDGPSDLLPVEFDTPQAQKKTAPKSEIANITFNFSEPGSVKPLPEIKPYSQEELIAKQSRSMISQRRTNSPAAPMVESDDVFVQIGSAEGLAFSVVDIAPREHGLDIAVSVTNTSQVPVSAVEFTIGSAPPQCLRQELANGESARHTIALRARPLTEPRDVKLTALPMGGAGEMVRGRLKLAPSMFLTAGTGDDFDSSVAACTAIQAIAARCGSAKEAVQRVTFVTRGAVVKRELAGERVVALVSKSEETVVLVLVKRGNDGFVAEVRTPDEKLTASIANELKKQFSDEDSN